MVSLIVLSRLQFHDKHCTHLSVWCIEYVKLMYLNGGLFSVKYPSRNAYEGYSSSSERKAWLIQIYFLTLSWFKQLKIKLKHSCLCLENLKREICILISWSQLLDRLVNEPVNFKNPGYTSANSAALALHSHIGQDLLFINNCSIHKMVIMKSNSDLITKSYLCPHLYFYNPSSWKLCADAS